MRTRGFTLVELLIVVVILAAAALAITRSPAASRTYALDLAAFEVAEALRFARSEALRTAAPHGARLSSADHRVRVYRLDTGSMPPSEEYDVVHPVDKKLYAVELDTGPGTRGSEVVAAAFLFEGDATPYESVSFDATGAPISPVDLALLNAGGVIVRYGGQTRTVTLAPMTGRVQQ